MPTYIECSRELDSYLSARIPVIALRTIEQSRATRLVRELAADPRRAGLPFWIHTMATGLRDLRTNSPVSDDRSISGAMDFAALQFTNRTQANFVFVDPDNLSDDTQFARHFAELGRIADNSAGSVIIITDNPLWSGLQRLGMAVALDPPDPEEMYASIVGFLSDNSSTVTISWDETDARRAANFLVGLTDAEAINLLATLAAKGSLDKDDVVQVPRLKNRIFSNLAGLELIDLKAADYSIGGLRNLREWLVRKKQLMYEDLRATKLRPPRGVLLVGVPGCGKSLSAKAIAAQWELPLYRLDLSTIMGQYVGQSEGRLRDALATADRVAPCVLWIDEIEKGLSGQHDSTGVTTRLIGQFLFWLQESTARVFVVATANNVSTLPPELLRKGRFDELFFVDLPDAADRADIIRMYYRRFLSGDPAAELVEELVSVSDGFAGADIEAVLHEVGAAAYLGGGLAALEPGFIKANFTNTMPLSRTNPEQIEDIRAWGRERAVPAGSTSSPLPSAVSGGRRRVVLTGD